MNIFYSIFINFQIDLYKNIDYIFQNLRGGLGKMHFLLCGNIYLEHIGLKIFWKLVCTEDKLYLYFKSYQIYTSLIQKYME